jgi:hypothetical protein
MTERVLDATVAAIRRAFPNLEDASLGEEYSYHSLPLCVIDAVFSMGVRYASAQKAVRSWCQSQEPQWPLRSSDPRPPHKISDFLRLTADVEGEDLSRRFFGGNRHRTSSKSGIMKADAVVRYARALHDCGIDDFADIRDVDRAARARSSVAVIPGHGSGISFDYLLMLAGDDNGVKADRWIVRFVAEAAGLPDVSPSRAARAIVEASDVLAREYPGLTPRVLDRLVWGVRDGQRNGRRGPRQRRADTPLTIDEARRRLARTFGVDPERVKITIE